MAASSLEQRVSALEVEVARLRTRLDKAEKPKADWLDKIWGSFANDPLFEEAVRYGREWREAQRPKPRKRRKT